MGFVKNFFEGVKRIGGKQERTISSGTKLVNHRADPKKIQGILIFTFFCEILH